ncbi:MAG: HIT family protein [Rikenellaceae bacterium]
MTVFSKIIAGEIPCYKVAEDEENFAFLDIEPLTEGHTLVVPKMEVDKIYDLPAERLSSLMMLAQKVAKKLDQVIECKRVAMVVIGLDVHHVHIHLIPLVNGAKDIDFTNPKMQYTKEEMEEIARKVYVEL